MGKRKIYCLVFTKRKFWCIILVNIEMEIKINDNIFRLEAVK